MPTSERPSCARCGRLLAEGLEEWDDSTELLCFGERDLLCAPSKKCAEPPRPMKVLCTGSREWTNEEIIRNELSALPAGTIIVHGACPWGADEIVDRIASELGFEMRRYHAKWGTYRRGYDGNARNQRMINEEHRPEEPIDLCLAFPKNTIQWGGTMDCMQRAENAGIRVKVVPKDACTGCGAANCSHLWPSQRKCCPDCSHK